MTVYIAAKGIHTGALMNREQQNQLKTLPAVDKILAEKALETWTGSEAAVNAVRAEVDLARTAIREKNQPAPDSAELAERAVQRLSKQYASRLKRVLNGTGIVVHTNLGRSPLGEKAIEAMVQAARGYSTLEYDLDKGKRGSRHDLVRHLLISLTGAEDALVTNNNAAALMLALTTLASRKDVIVSRGQLVEIGGSFRIPDICKAGGARLHEVGTTNRTRIADYRAALSNRTGILLRVHTSNFRVVGFTEDVALEELVELGNEAGLPVVDDLGSGALVDPGKYCDLKSEPLVSESVQAEASVVTFSGDKLLGGPQAGLAVGKAEFIGRMRKHPMMRVVRPDKLTFAALDATLRSYLAPVRLTKEIPLWQMLSLKVPQLEQRALELAANLVGDVKAAGLFLGVDESDSFAGGGSLPTERLQSRALVFSGPGGRLKRLQDLLRSGKTAMIGYVRDNVFKLDLRTLWREDDAEILSLLRAALTKLAEDTR